MSTLDKKESKTEQEEEMQEQLKQDIRKITRRAKDKHDNRISFAHFKPTKDGRPQEELTDDGLIKRAFRNWSKLRTPPYYKQTALYVITKNYLEARRIHKINNKDEIESSYTKLCNTCLEEEDGILHKMMECPPIRYINDVITNSAERVLGVQISNKESQRKPCDQTRLLLFLDVPPLARKDQNKETTVTQNAMAAVANIATATARRMWLQNHIRKPTTQLTQQITCQTIKSVEQCYRGKPEEKLIHKAIDQIIAKFNRDITNEIEIKYHKPSIKDRLLVEQYQIPTMIYEEAQGNALIRTLQHHDSSKYGGLLELQVIISNFFTGINTRLQRTEIAWLTRQRIAALTVCAANSVLNVKGAKEQYWRKRSRSLKQEIKDRKLKQPRVSNNRELAELSQEASNANNAIEAIQTICRTDDGENLLNTTKMTYRRQLRASHLQMLEKMKEINNEIRMKQNTQLQW